MAPLSSLQNANDRTLKRSFTSLTTSPSSSPERARGPSTVGARARTVKLRAGGSLVQDPSRGRSLHRSAEDMPSAAGPRMYENHIPSFMSVYDMDTSAVESPGVEPPTKTAAPEYINQLPHRPLQNQQPPENKKSQTQIHSHQHRNSTSSTQASDSTDSSPTTTISTVDSSSLSDPSPSSSPESPITLVPLSSFSGSFGMDSFQSLNMADTNPVRLPLSNERPMTSPAPRKPKNPKSLALNLDSNIGGFASSELSSPSFIKPPTLKGRKKPSLLSLNTGAANSPTLSIDTLGSPGVPTMLQRRALKHSISTPQMLVTPGFGPCGGMTFGDRNPPRLVGASRLKESNLATNTFTIDETDQEPPSGTQMATRIPGVPVGGDTFDRLHSGEDAKSPSYPEGPILMHEPSVHLYLEPKLEEAMKFDVVINVAREVKNPFKEMMEARDAKESAATAASASKTTASESRDTPPDTAASMLSFHTAYEVQPSSSESSPTTPKAAPEGKIPEYIHVPWDHNTDVKDELWDLCQTIEARVKEGKKVLVHCQQGASRSATLIIAYGMYINQDLGANEAYSRAQAKSRWVNPNMSLLFSLNDFKKVIESKKEEKRKAEKINATRQVKHRSAMLAETPDPPAPTRARGNSTPTSATRDKALRTSEEAKETASMSDATIRRLADFDFGFGDSTRKEAQSRVEHPQPVKPQEPIKPPEPVEPQQPVEPQPSVEAQPPVEPEPHIERLPTNFDWESELMSPRVSEMTDNPLRSFPGNYSSGSDGQAPSTIFSSRPCDYPRSSFFSTVHHPLPTEDPRSPPTRGEVPITRSIDDFL